MRSSHQELDHCRWEIFQASHPAEGTRWGSQQNNGESNHSSRCTESVSFLGSKFFNRVTGHSKFGKKKARALNHNMSTFHTMILTSLPVSFVPYLLSLWAPLASCSFWSNACKLLPQDLCICFLAWNTLPPWHLKGSLPGSLQVSLSANLAKRPFLIITTFITSNLVLPNSICHLSFLHSMWLLLLLLLLSPPHTWMETLWKPDFGRCCPILLKRVSQTVPGICRLQSCLINK